MKRIIILFVMILLGFTSYAALVNGGFVGGLAGKIASLKSASYINRGWYSSDSGSKYLKFSNSSLQFKGPQVRSAPIMVGQLFTHTGEGEQSLNVDIVKVDSNRNLKLRIQLYGYKQLTRGKTILFANSIKLDSTSTPVNSQYYAVPALINDACTDVPGNGVLTTKRIKFNVSTDYAFYGLRITVNRPEAADSIAFDNISITAVKEYE